ncbi:uncharacterized protein [Palaemon carinicauda]|uniref:uncharacterized protein n=1 Tax=Palaemon carinicauda TaxID=392227 RepID=UPI0035B58F10
MTIVNSGKRKIVARYGLPWVIQTDCGTNFTSKMFRSKCAELAIRHITSVSYHPESQGVVERFHQTFKSIFKKNYAHGSEWDKELPLALFAIRNHPNASTGVAPFDLIFGHKVRGPLHIFCQAFGADQRGKIKVGEFVDDLRKRMVSAWNFARDNLGTTQNKMKVVYDRNSKARSFEPGEMVLKAYHGKTDVPFKVVPEPVAVAVERPPQDSADLLNQVSSDALFSNVQNLGMVEEDLFRDSPGRTSFLCHDIDVGCASPIKQSPYRLNPIKRDLVEKEIIYMLEYDLIQPSVSPWSSPVVLVGKADGKFRMCVDYRKVNAHNKNDSFPLPHIDDCLDQIASAIFITKLDLLKGCWQVLLSDRACKISAFVTPFGLYECRVMPFGMKNAACTFQRLKNRVICGLKGTEIYIDDLVVYTNDWSTDMVRLRKVFEALRSAVLVINLAECEFGQAKKPFVIAVDASDIRLGGVLFQRDNEGELHPISYFTQIWTDHNPLVFIEWMKGDNQRIMRWALLLQEFKLVIKQIKGALHTCNLSGALLLESVIQRLAGATVTCDWSLPCRFLT